MRRFAVFAFAAAGVVALLGGAARSGAAGEAVCTTSGPLVCVDLVGTPATVAPSGDTLHFVDYVGHVSNEGNQAATHVTTDISLTGGLVLVSVKSDVGTCSVTAEPTCTIGRLQAGATATVEFVARAPETEGAASASLDAHFDETQNDSPTPDPKQDSVLVEEGTTVQLPDGSAASFVPKGSSLTLTTDPTDTGVATASDPLIGQAIITSSPIDTTASIDEVPLTITCPKKVVCRSGDWFHADIPGKFNPPLAFPLRWDSTLIPSSLSVKKFALLYTECVDGCKLQIISARCSSPTPAASELPCLTGVAKLSDGDFVATLINDHNGWMK